MRMSDEFLAAIGSGYSPIRNARNASGGRDLVAIGREQARRSSERTDRGSFASLAVFPEYSSISARLGAAGLIRDQWFDDVVFLRLHHVKRSLDLSE